MKKQILYFSLAALALAACSEQADFTQADIANAAIENANAGDVPVAFGTYIGNQGTTRGGEIGEITTNNILNGTDDTSAGTDHKVPGFGVFAFLTDNDGWATDGASTIPNFMYNQQVTWSSTIWDYTPKKYWPNGTDVANAANAPSNTATEAAIQKLSFFAYAPYVDPTTGGYDASKGITALTSNNTAGDPIVSYSLPASNPTGKNVVDLLWGTRGQLTYEETDAGNNTVAALNNNTYNTDLTKQKVDERVRFLFKHALAKIADIKVVYDLDGNGSGEAGFGTDDNNTLVTISNVTIDPNGDSQFYKTGKFNIATGTWDKTSATYYADATSLLSGSETINPDIAEPEAASSPQYNSGWKKHDNSTDLSGVKVTAKQLYSNYEPIMLIPAPEHTPQLTVSVTYLVRTYDEKLNEAANNDNSSTGRTWSKVTQTITNNVTLPQLAVNTKYTLVMHLGLTSVKFSAEIADWDEGATKEVWLPSNVVNTTAWTLNEGEAKTVNAAADCETYTITLNNITDGVASINISGTGNYKSDGSSATAPSSNTSTVTIKLNPNTTASPVSSVITLQGKDSENADKGSATTVTIVQAAKPATP